MSHSRLIIALDYPEAGPALALADRLSPERCALKVGKELFVAEGPQLVDALVRRGYRVFLDLKFHDIPNTVAGACRSAAATGAWMVNVHALGGAAMMAAAREALGETGDRPLLTAVTVLTSHSDATLREIGLAGPADAAVCRLAELARGAGVDGVVCSAREAALVRERCGDGFLRVTPGIRPAWAAKGDQARVLSPADAVAGGATHLVVGRPVTRADEPLAALARLERELAAQDET
ncbi:orotidine-5'-phosphate decarboxylase [Alkalilimnicola ehrlichii MLHE-1]|uniref:Orotidine 5'-phosphate decarboxylase n=1 Tax=Alkalilimnicola ehrlichii (strain ATCC BAA-1101 / DSM 17681 / MLHE-1) TaxID=187272 RepID=PYRF_ALKEH|nr:orotidine-5'-phosphate decarboxylase [Alkalilimnicola ehrlichii]Q0AA48.1 RecName: Full=Orotidine 5'-phosphate decarboxylase; AltName: Full=OMP decarboxylase; Short=OMPDCase; Short=OMPdecase [Alkalilimnicola ehrlichii MLHE-1]ABI56289.1 orotidine-5'-phosphate decarboxylase [Alkalilimnicola ehrlichii MLHE-1]